MNDLLQISGPTWGEPDTAAADRIEAALGADAIERRVEHRGELTLDLPLDRYIEVCTYLRDQEGYDLLSDVTVVDYLGYAGEVAGYWGGDGRDINRDSHSGKRAIPEPAGPKRFGVSATFAKVNFDPRQHLNRLLLELIRLARFGEVMKRIQLVICTTL